MKLPSLHTISQTIDTLETPEAVAGFLAIPGATFLSLGAAGLVIYKNHERIIDILDSSFQQGAEIMINAYGGSRETMRNVGTSIRGILTDTIDRIGKRDAGTSFLPVLDESTQVKIGGGSTGAFSLSELSTLHDEETTDEVWSETLPLDPRGEGFETTTPSTLDETDKKAIYASARNDLRINIGEFSQVLRENKGIQESYPEVQGDIRRFLQVAHTSDSTLPSRELWTLSATVFQGRMRKILRHMSQNTSKNGAEHILERQIADLSDIINKSIDRITLLYKQ